MQIEKNRVVYFHYRLRAEEGDFNEQSEPGQPSAYLHGFRSILPALEKAMEGRQPGDSLELTLAPEEAYGPPLADARQRVPIKHLLHMQAKNRLRPGMAVKVNTRNGPMDARIIKVGKFNVDIDTNHPLAGLTLTFVIDIVEVREATAEEIAHGHVHGAGGHYH